jgi:hypothetical protein
LRGLNLVFTWGATQLPTVYHHHKTQYKTTTFHQDYLNLIEKAEGDEVQLVLAAHIPPRILNIHHWIRGIVSIYYFRFCEDETNREDSKLDLICSKTLKMYMKQLMKNVEKSC